MSRYWKAWLAFAGTAPAVVAAVVIGDATAVTVSGCAVVTAVGAVLFGPENAKESS